MSTRLEEYEGAPEVEGNVLYEPDWYLREIPGAFHAPLARSLQAEGEAFKPSAPAPRLRHEGRGPLAQQGGLGDEVRRRAGRGPVPHDGPARERRSLLGRLLQ